MKVPAPPALSIAALLLALLGALEFGVLHLLAPLENRLLDSFQRQAAAGLSPDPQIVIVDIDDASLARMQARAGRWPWPREIHAELVRALQAQKPRAIVFDILFSEGDTHGKESDRKFREAVRGLDNVFFPMARLTEKEAPSMGVVLATRAGYDPYGLPAVLQMLNAMSASDSELALMFSTHPAPSARLDTLERAMGSQLDRFAGKPGSGRFEKLVLGQ